MSITSQRYHADRISVKNNHPVANGDDSLLLLSLTFLFRTTFNISFKQQLVFYPQGPEERYRVVVSRLNKVLYLKLYDV